MFSLLRTPLFVAALAALPAALIAAEGINPTSDHAAAPSHVLVFPDGDRVRGQLIGRDGEFLVFQSQRFGEIVVPSEGVRIETPPPAPKAVETSPELDSVSEPDLEAAPAPEDAIEMRDRARPSWASPAALAMALGDFLGAWKGRFSVSSSVVTKTREQRDVALALRVQREWEETEAQLDFRYDLRKTDGITNRDILKSDGLLRHKLNERYFAHYRPSAEWNRNFEIGGAPADYVLLQQEIGVGVNLLNLEQRALRLGVAENVFSLWTLPDSTNDHRHNQSLFGEVEFELPWRISIGDRYIWFSSLSEGEQGWENRLELTKKFSDALSLGLRQESRHNNPDTRVEDFSLWRLLVGLDF